MKRSQNAVTFKSPSAQETIAEGINVLQIHIRQIAEIIYGRRHWKPMLTVEQVSKHFNLSCATIRRKAAEKKINAIRIGREYRFEWIDLWSCESGKIPRTSNRTRYKENLLTKSEIAANFQVSVRTVERWIVDGMPTRNVFSNVRCNPHDVTEWHLGRGAVDRNGYWQQ